MWPFRKKKIFKIIWRYIDYENIRSCVDYIKATDVLSACNKLRKQESPYSVYISSWEEI